MKSWLYTCTNDEGITRFDILVGCVAVMSAFLIPAVLIKLFC